MVSSITAEYRTIIQNSDILSKEGKDSAIEKVCLNLLKPIYTWDSYIIVTFTSNLHFKLDDITFLVGTAPWIFNDTYLQELNFEVHCRILF